MEAAAVADEVARDRRSDARGRPVRDDPIVLGPLPSGLSGDGAGGDGTAGEDGQGREDDDGREARIVGRADDGQSLECLVVELDGTTDRPDGSTYHITWSLGPGRKARESNDVLKERGWEELDHPIPIKLEPGRF